MVQFAPHFGLQEREAPKTTRRNRGLPTRPPRALTVIAMLVLAIIGYHFWNDAHQPTPAVELQYPGSVRLLYENEPQWLPGKSEPVGPTEDRIYGIPVAQANKVSYHDILAWYHERFLARGWTYQNAYPAYPTFPVYPLSQQYLAGETWSQGCEYLFVRIWAPESADPSFNDPKVYPITFELWQQNYCPHS